MFSLLGFTLAWSPTNASPSAKIIFVFLNLISVSTDNLLYHFFWVLSSIIRRFFDFFGKQQYHNSFDRPRNKPRKSARCAFFAVIDTVCQIKVRLIFECYINFSYKRQIKDKAFPQIFWHIGRKQKQLFVLNVPDIYDRIQAEYKFAGSQ